MQKVRGMVSCEGKVVRDGIASILNSIKNFEVVGLEGSDILKEAFELQPDLIVYELQSLEKSEYETIKELKELCSWTKVIIFSSHPVNRKRLNKFLENCDGYLQGPLLPGFLLKAVELACYSGYFFFLGSPRDISFQKRENIKQNTSENLKEKTTTKKNSDAG
jgi:DNA-binding NarL/FixJ family response regulator